MLYSPIKIFKMKKVIPIVSLTFLLLACKKEKSPIPPVSPDTHSGVNGNITGKVTQYDQFGIQNTGNLNTVTVTIDGTAYITTTDAGGNYTLANVAPGTYNISFNRTGAALWQKQQVSFAGNGTYYLNGYSTEKPTYSFSGIIKDSTVIPAGSHKIFAILQMTPLTSDGGILVLRSKSPNVDITDPSSYLNVYQNTIPANVSSCKLWIDYGYQGTYYYKAYPYPNIYDGSFYDDVPSGKRIYSNYGNALAGTFSVTIP